MSADALQAEYEYRYMERLGILCEDRFPTAAQRRIAHDEAQEAVTTLARASVPPGCPACQDGDRSPSPRSSGEPPRPGISS